MKNNPRFPETIPSGFRRLEVGEIIESGDQYADSNKGWVSITGSVGQPYADKNDGSWVKPSNCIAITRRPSKGQKFRIGDRVRIVNSPSKAIYNGKVGTVIHVRKSRVMPERDTYFLDLDAPQVVFGNDAVNLRGEFLELVVEKVEVKLNREYTAIVTKDEINVGGNKISLETFAKLEAAVAKVRQ